MGFLETRSSLRFLNAPDRRLEACTRLEPECVVLDVDPGVDPSDKPAVRIFLGTEPAQYRAERVFVWSIEANRDRSRVYEIYLMKDLAGFDRRGWTTGFTGYRFAVPHLAGGTGRAIFNDVDQAYFADPAELFDADLGNHGYLATSDSETSVMLIDCSRMASVWTLAAAQRELKKTLLAKTLEIPGIRGNLAAQWNARDGEFVAGESKLLHWTTLHTQPWRPVPQRFAYQPNLNGQVWFDLKRAADAAGFQIFDAQKPSSLYTRLIEQLRNGARAADTGSPRRFENRTSPERSPGLADLLSATGAATLLDYRLSLDDPERANRRTEASGAPKLSFFELANPAEAESGAEAADGVVCSNTLDRLPEEDVPWVIDDLFKRARQFVYASVENRPDRTGSAENAPFASEPHDIAWWSAHFEAAADRYPKLRWRFAVGGRTRFGTAQTQIRDGHCRVVGSPSVWLLSDGGLASADSAMALAVDLGWSYEHKGLQFRNLARLPNWLLGSTCMTLDAGRSTPLAPPWPDVVISAGRSCVPVARWIRDQSRGRTRLVHVGAEGGENAELFDAVVSPACARLWPHPHRVETAATLTAVTSPATSGALDQAPAGSRVGWVRMLREAIVRRANLRPMNSRGTPRPQKRLEYLCARLIERGWIHPPMDWTAPHEIFGLAIASPVGASAESARGAPMLKTADAALHVKRLLR